MFLSLPESRVAIPAALRADGEDCWSVIRRQMFVPWFIVTFESIDDSTPYSQTLLVSDPDWLRAVLQSPSVARFRQVLRMVYQYDSGHWGSHEIQEVWNELSTPARIAILESGAKYKFADSWDDKPCDLEVAGPNWIQIYGSQDHQGADANDRPKMNKGQFHN